MDSGCTEIHHHQGFAYKKNGRLSRWVLRFFTLAGSELSYTRDKPSTAVRATFRLIPGCVLTELNKDETMLTGRKLFTFWVVWPHDAAMQTPGPGTHRVNKERKSAGEGRTEHKEQESDDEVTDDKDCGDVGKSDNVKTVSLSTENAERPLVLKQVVEQEKISQRNIREAAALQIERHVAHDANISSSLKLAAFGLGGVLVGVLTAGVGLVPYITVVGLTAIAGGSAAVLKYRAPPDRRLIIGLESLADATLWRSKIEAAIGSLEAKPVIAKQVNAEIISALLDASKRFGWWRRVSVWGGMRITGFDLPSPREDNSTEHLLSSLTGQCRQAQIVLPRAPVAIFLHLMEQCPWGYQILRGESAAPSIMQVVKSIDSHTDIVSVTFPQSAGWSWPGCSGDNGGGWSAWASQLFALPMFHLLASRRPTNRQLLLTRFWHRDKDGGFFIAFNNGDSQSDHKGCISSVDLEEKMLPLRKAGQTEFSAIVTICPSRQRNEEEDDKKRALVVATVHYAVSNGAQNAHCWSPGEGELMAHAFLVGVVGELRETLRSRGQCSKNASSDSPCVGDWDGIPARKEEHIDRGHVGSVVHSRPRNEGNILVDPLNVSPMKHPGYIAKITSSQNTDSMNATASSKNTFNNIQPARSTTVDPGNMTPSAKTTQLSSTPDIQGSAHKSIASHSSKPLVLKGSRGVLMMQPGMHKRFGIQMVSQATADAGAHFGASGRRLPQTLRPGDETTTASQRSTTKRGEIEPIPFSKEGNEETRAANPSPTVGTLRRHRSVFSTVHQLLAQVSCLASLSKAADSYILVLTAPNRLCRLHSRNMNYKEWFCDIILLSGRTTTISLPTVTKCVQATTEVDLSKACHFTLQQPTMPLFCHLREICARYVTTVPIHYITTFHFMDYLET